MVYITMHVIVIKMYLESHESTYFVCNLILCNCVAQEQYFIVLLIMLLRS